MIFCSDSPDIAHDNDDKRGHCWKLGLETALEKQEK